jgi:hypothetical protein
LLPLCLGRIPTTEGKRTKGKNMKLYEIASEFQALEELVDADDEAVQDTLEGLKGELEYKSMNIGFFIGNIENTIAGIKEAEKNMAKRRKALENKAERIRTYLKDNMEACGILKIETPHFVLSVVNNPPKVEIQSEELVPDEYKSEETVIKLDKKKIKDALKNGGVLGAELVQGTRLKIK